MDAHDGHGDFKGGTADCIARVTARTAGATQIILARRLAIEVMGEPVRRCSHFIRSLRSLPVRIRA